MRLLSKLVLFASLSFLPACAAINFDGTDDRIQTGSPFGTLVDNGTYTMSIWMKPEGTAPTVALNNPWFGGVFGDDEGFVGLARANMTGVGDRLFAFNFPGTNRHVETTYTVGDWTNLVQVQNGGNMKFYKDGSLVGTIASTGPSVTNGDVAFGKTRNTPTYFFFNGSLDDARLYDRAFTEAEVEAMYLSRNKRLRGALANGLVLHYEFDEFAVGETLGQLGDDSMNNNSAGFEDFANPNAALNGNVATNLGQGTSLDFDGVDDSLFTGATADSLFDNGSYSLSIWMKPEGIAPTVPLNQPWTAGVFGDRSGFLSIARANMTGLGDRLFAYNFPGANRQVDATYTIGQWTHLVQVQNGGNMKFYKDGSLVGTVASTGPSTTSAEIKIGKVSPSYQPYEGGLDDARVYNKPLTASEVSFLYNGSGLNPGTSNLEALWTFDASHLGMRDSSGRDDFTSAEGGASLQYSEGILRKF